MSAADLNYIEAPALAELLEDDAAAGGLAIIDVRDEDFLGGHIPGAENHPFEQWENEGMVNDLAQRMKGKDRVVLHCMYSKVRGPMCARKIIQAMELLLDPSQPMPEILVLRGGFAGWSQTCSDMVEM